MLRHECEILADADAVAQRGAEYVAAKAREAVARHGSFELAVSGDPELRRLLDEVQRRELDPLSAVREILEKVFRIDRDGGTGAS